MLAAFSQRAAVPGRTGVSQVNQRPMSYPSRFQTAGFRVALIALAGGLFCQSLHAESERAEPKNQLRIHWAKSSETDLYTVVVGDYDPSPENNYLVGASWGHHLSDTLFGLPFPMTANVGAQWFNERGFQPDAYGANAFVKAHYLMRVPWTQKHVKLGLGEGLSYVTRIPMSEQRDFARKGVESVKLMNYLEWTIDLPLSQFAPMQSLMRDGSGIEELSVGFIVWHRSTVFGLFGDSQGGINFMGFGVEAQF